MMENTIVESTNTATALVVVAITVLCTFYWGSSSSSNDKDKNKNNDHSSSCNSIPDAVGGNALLGNAIQYKDNPTGCIRDQERLTNNKLFRLNLAGRRMIIVGSCPKLQKQIASQPESVLSSTRAVAEIGFEYSLGHFNVYDGTAWHKQILKDYIMGTNFNVQFLPHIFKGLVNAMEIESAELSKSKSSSTSTVEGSDLFKFVRRCVLRTTLDVFVSPLLLERDPTLLEALMIFQDAVEDTTAKAAVLPRWIALPLCLWPIQKSRSKVQRRITRLLSEILLAVAEEGDNNNNEKNNGGTTTTTNGNCSRLKNWGPWLKAYAKDKTPPSKAAEHLVGLIFAAHKNPSIGAAQTFCFLRSELSPEQQTQAYEEATNLCQQFTTAAEDASPSSSSTNLEEALLQAKTLRRCVLETMRLTAHTLGAVRYANQDIEVQQVEETASTDDQKRTTYKICKGETVSMAHHTMHMEESVWGADGNKLERFSLDRPEWKEDDENNVNIGIPLDHYKFTTFSNGTHKCPGEKVALALMELQVALLLLQETQLVPGKPLAPVSFERATLAQRDGPVPFTTNK